MRCGISSFLGYFRFKLAVLHRFGVRSSNVSIVIDIAISPLKYGVNLAWLECLKLFDVIAVLPRGPLITYINCIDTPRTIWSCLCAHVRTHALCMCATILHIHIRYWPMSCTWNKNVAFGNWTAQTTWKAWRLEKPLNASAIYPRLHRCSLGCFPTARRRQREDLASWSTSTIIRNATNVLNLGFRISTLFHIGLNLRQAVYEHKSYTIILSTSMFSARFQHVHSTVAARFADTIIILVTWSECSPGPPL